MSAERIFDREHYQHLNSARREVVCELISEVRPKLALETAVDVGCGLGYFSALLKTLGLEVTGVDGREQNVVEARRRNPDIGFFQYDAEDSELTKLGTFDLVFCFGLLYHLENPLLTIRHLQRMARKLLLVEAVMFPGDEPIMALIDEGSYDDQGLRHIAFYPTEACLVKMFYRAGFTHVYGLAKQPDHSGYHATSELRRIRTMLAASFAPLDSTQLKLASEPRSEIVPWDPRKNPERGSTVQRLKRFASKPLFDKVSAVRKVFDKR